MARWIGIAFVGCVVAALVAVALSTRIPAPLVSPPRESEPNGERVIMTALVSAVLADDATAVRERIAAGEELNALVDDRSALAWARQPRQEWHFDPVAALHSGSLRTLIPYRSDDGRRETIGLLMKAGALDADQSMTPPAGSPAGPLRIFNARVIPGSGTGKAQLSVSVQNVTPRAVTLGLLEPGVAALGEVAVFVDRFDPDNNRPGPRSPLPTLRLPVTGREVLAPGAETTVEVTLAYTFPDQVGEVRFWRPGDAGTSVFVVPRAQRPASAVGAPPDAEAAAVLAAIRAEDRRRPGGVARTHGRIVPIVQREGNDGILGEALCALMEPQAGATGFTDQDLVGLDKLIAQARASPHIDFVTKARIDEERQHVRNPPPRAGR